MEDLKDKHLEKRKKRNFKPFLIAISGFLVLASFYYISYLRQPFEEPLTAMGEEVEDEIPFEEEMPVIKEPSEPDEPEVSSAAQEQPLGYMWPVMGRLMREPGWYYKEDYGEWQYFSGIALSANAGEAVFASMDGKILSIIEYPGEGIFVTLGHEGEKSTVYEGLSSTDLTVGTWVNRGQVLGPAKGSSVSFRVISEGEPVNPLQTLGSP